ncbi:hypothetical protein [Photobacterium sp. GB-72]|uniref:hypothetical protein n=1 Tax=Photobacterium sp. GB-72 TaxID=2022105 RepID=UPI000D17BBD4|nr:hypothetical protein [Photobacterium sp. GB-72]PSV30326.1 hypothetical protein C9J40_13665 [Photobacterium sp. GB-72]
MKSPSQNFIVWHILVVLLVTSVSYCFRSDIKFPEIQGLVSILQNTSAMIFTIMGLWIAYVYPNVILRIVQPSKVVAVFSDEDELTVKLLVGVVVLSAATMGFLVLGTSLQVFIVKTSMFATYPNVFSFIGLWFLLALTYVQLFCIYMVIATSVNFVMKLKNVRHSKALSKKLDGK